MAGNQGRFGFTGSLTDARNLSMNVGIYLLSAALLTGFFGPPQINGKVEGGRYFAPNKEFSVALPAEYYWPHEKELPGQLFVDLLFKGDEGSFAVFGLHYIEWISLQKPMSPTDFAQVAPTLVKEHVRKHFDKIGIFELKDAKAVEGIENPALGFVATGSINGKPCYWQGVTIGWGDRIAFLGEAHPNSTMGTKQISSVDQLSPHFIIWVRSLHREQKP